MNLRAIAFLITFAMLLAIDPAMGRMAGPIPIVAGENFYGNIAQQIGGLHVAVNSILSNPDQDPHFFEVSPSVARAVSGARFVIYNGIDYDPWMPQLLAAAASSSRKAIDVGALTGRKPGDNPHIWYDPRTMTALAKAIAADLTRADPADLQYYRRRLLRFDQSIKPVAAKIVSLRKHLSGIPVTATEPVFGYMFAALGMRVRNMGFQIAVMNNTEPSASEVGAFENDLKLRRVHLLVYNSQASDPVAARMRRLAQAAHIPVVGVTETEPPGMSYQGWMLSELDAVDRALRRSKGE